MTKLFGRGLMAAATMLMIFSSQPAAAGVCWWGECSEMTNEFRSGELRPQTIALLPARSTLTQDGVFSSENKIGETAELEDLLASSLEKQFVSRGYTVRRVSFDEIGADPKLAELLNAANQRYDEEYATIVAFKVNDVKNRRYTIGEEGRKLANYLGVDAAAYPRMQIAGSSSTKKLASALGGHDGKAGGINMEFGLVHAKTGNIEAFFGGVAKSGTGPFGGVSFKKILKKGEKYMKDIAKTATKKMPDFDETLKAQKLDENAEALVMYEPIDEDIVLGELDDLLSEE